VRPSAIHIVASAIIETIITVALMIIWRFVERIVVNFINRDRGMLKIKTKPTAFDIVSAEWIPPKNRYTVNNIVMYLKGALCFMFFFRGLWLCINRERGILISDLVGFFFFFSFIGILDDFFPG
jgi:hypothetical protein